MQRPVHMCRCVSCTAACPFHCVIRLRANWAAVRQPVQASHHVIPASERESWAALCGVLRYPNRHTGVHPRYRLAGCRLGGRHDGAKGTRGGERAGMTAQRGHAGEKGQCVRGAFFCAVARITTVSFRAPNRNPGWLMRSIVLCLACCHPRHRLAGCRLGGRHDGAKGTRGERKGGKGRCAFLHCAPHPHTVIPGLTRNPGRPYAWYCTPCYCPSAPTPPKAPCRRTG